MPLGIPQSDLNSDITCCKILYHNSPERLGLEIKAKSTVGFRYREICLDSSPLVTDDNAEVWSRFLAKKIPELISEESMLSDDYKAFEWEYASEIQKAIDDKIYRQKKNEIDEYRKKLGRNILGYIPDGLKVDYSRFYGDHAEKAFNWHPNDADDFMFQVRSLERLCQASAIRCIENGRPDAAYIQAYEVCRRLPAWMSSRECKTYLAAHWNRLRKTVVQCYSGAVNAALAWNNAEKLKEINTLIQSHCAQYGILGLKSESIMDLRGKENIVGAPIEIKRKPNFEEYLEQRDREVYERERLAQEAERKSLIPLNDDYERNIFERFRYDCDFIAVLMENEERKIHELCDNKQFAEAALKLMQLTKSMCRHFVSDEHYNYFDDLYAPEYVVNDLVRYFNDLIHRGILPDDVKSFLKLASVEIMESETAKEYGVPGKMF